MTRLSVDVGLRRDLAVARAQIDKLTKDHERKLARSEAAAARRLKEHQAEAAAKIKALTQEIRRLTLATVLAEKAAEKAKMETEMYAAQTKSTREFYAWKKIK